MEKKRMVGFEQQVKPKRNIEWFDPVPEAERVLMDHPDLMIEAREINVMFALAKEGDLSEAKQAMKQLTGKVQRLGLSPEKKKLLAQQLLHQLEPTLAWEVSAPNEIQQVIRESVEDLKLPEKDSEDLTAEVSAMVEREAAFEEYIASHPELNEYGDKIRAHIAAFLEHGDPSEHELAEQEIKGLFAEIQKLPISAELLQDLFHSMGESLAEAWGQNQFIARNLGEQYLLLKRLGSGVAGEAYAALDREGKDAVVKILAPVDQNTKERIPVDRDMATDFQREMDVLRQLDHPNIVKFIDGQMIPTDREEGGEIVNEGWYAMEHLDGRELKSVLDEGKIGVEQAVEVLLGVSKGLATLHEKGIIHRDIKPHNVLVNFEKNPPEVHLIDFGIVLIDDEQRQEQRLYGTPRYGSPEHIVPQDLTGKSDVYSLGIIAYEMLTGIHPFVSPDQTLTSTDVWIAVTDYEHLDPPSEIAASRVSPDLSLMVMRMLAKDPGLRPTADEAAQFFAMLLQKRQEESARAGLEKTLADTQSLARPAEQPGAVQESAGQPDEFKQLAESVLHTWPGSYMSPAILVTEMQRINRQMSYPEARRILKQLAQQGELAPVGHRRNEETGEGEDRYRIIGLQAERTDQIQAQITPKEMLKYLSAHPKGAIEDVQLYFEASEEEVQSMLRSYDSGELSQSLAKGAKMYFTSQTGTYEYIKPKSWFSRLFSRSS